MASGSVKNGGNSGGSVLDAVNDMGSAQPNTNDMTLAQLTAHKKIIKEKERLEAELQQKIASGEIKTAEEAAAIRMQNSKAVAKIEQEFNQKEADKKKKQALIERANERKEESFTEKMRMNNLKKRIADERKAAKEALAEADTDEEKKNAKHDKRIADLKGALVAGADAISTAASNMLKAATASAEKYMGTYAQYMSDIEARIQGAYSGMTYESLNDIIVSNTNGSPYIRYEDAIENLSRLVQTGTMVNLTQRTFLATISGKIAATFDAFDSSLLRIIRLQQEDTTGARLGMEAELTRLFNYYFSDSSYLVESFDNVASSLTNLSSKLDYASSVEMEYQIQKWLGALGSVGADSSTLTTLSEAINALGTGDVDWLTSNTAMQNLLVMASNRAGLDYSDMLVNGVTSAQVNALLGAIIEYIQDVTSGVNNVVQSQYASLFGITIADIRAFKNISDQTIESLYKSGMTYADTLDSLTNQLAMVPNRVHLSEKIDNLIDNVMASTGVGIASNSGTYGFYKAVSLLESLTGGIEIPTIGVLGSFLGLGNTIEQILKSATVGIGLIGSLVGAIGGLSNGAGLTLSRWSGDWDKGSYLGYNSVGKVVTTSSANGVIANSDTTGMQQSVYDEQEQSAEEVSGADTGESDEMNQAIKFIKEYLEGGGDNATRPLKVTVVDNTPYIKVNGVTIQGGEQSLDMTTILRMILERLNLMGEADDPLYVQMQSSFYDDSNINDIIGGRNI